MQPRGKVGASPGLTDCWGGAGAKPLPGGVVGGHKVYRKALEQSLHMKYGVCIALTPACRKNGIAFSSVFLRRSLPLPVSPLLTTLEVLSSTSKVAWRLEWS
jgi:hypothetical protein